MKKIMFFAAIALLTTSAVFADIARPDKTPQPKPGVSTTIEIKMDKSAKEAKLLIPKSQIKQLRAELDALDDDNGNTAAATGGFTRLQTIVSGAFLSLAFVFGGMWFVRSGRSSTKGGKALAIAAILGGVGAATTVVFANAGPPPAARNITSKLFDQKVFFPYGFAYGKIKIETTDGTQVKLIVPDVSETPASE
ncbi:MAG: hypothetical protein ABL999_13705 [Pyrinomonadaceae bacterium]